MKPTKKGIRVTCSTCLQTKAPRGRSVATAAANSHCDHECPGYNQPPLVGSLWPGETDADFGFPCSNDGTEPVNE